MLGGHAVAFYGYPRGTQDFDVWVHATKENATRAYNAIAAFGFPCDGIDTSTLSDPNIGIRMGVPPMRLEIITFATGLVFADAYKNRKRVKYDEAEANMISLEDLIRNKQSTGRNKDLADLDHLPGGSLSNKHHRNT
jgi:hypothetical protein